MSSVHQQGDYSNPAEFKVVREASPAPEGCRHHSKNSKRRALFRPKQTNPTSCRTGSRIMRFKRGPLWYNLNSDWSIFDDVIIVLKFYRHFWCSMNHDRTQTHCVLDCSWPAFWMSMTKPPLCEEPSVPGWRRRSLRSKEPHAPRKHCPNLWSTLKQTLRLTERCWGRERGNKPRKLGFSLLWR